MFRVGISIENEDLIGSGKVAEWERLLNGYKVSIWGKEDF